MPTNLPAEARAKLAEYSAARTLEEKVAKLEEAIGLIPDHKGTEKLRRQLRRRLAELKRELEERRQRRAGGGRDEFSVEKEGWAQIALLGAANSGKSSLFNALTGARSPVADYPLTTTRPFPGMTLYQDAELQVVDLPSVLTEDLRPTSFASRSIAVARNSDLLLLVADASRDPEAELNELIDLLIDHGISLKQRSCEVKIQRTDTGGLRLVVMGTLRCSYQEVLELLKSYGYRSAIVKVIGDADLDEIEEQVVLQPVYKRAIAVLNKADLVDFEVLAELRKRVAESLKIPVVAASSQDAKSLEELKEVSFRSLEMIRVYTQKDGVVSRKPILMPRGSTVIELAELIHKELARNFRYARVWGKSVRVQGQRVGPDHQLEDGDIVEIRSDWRGTT